MKSVDAINSTARLNNPHALIALLDFEFKTPAGTLNRVDCMHVILEGLYQNDFCDMRRLESLGAASDQAALCWHFEPVKLILVHIKGILADSVPHDRSCLSPALVNAARPFECEDRCRQAAIQSSVMQKLITVGADVN